MRNRGGCGTLNLSYVKDYVKKKKKSKKIIKYTVDYQS